jgi:hypothetical protein
MLERMFSRRVAGCGMDSFGSHEHNNESSVPQNMGKCHKYINDLKKDSAPQS